MKKQILSVVYMFLITLFFASLVSAVKLMNDKRIELNQTIKLQRIILRVLQIPIDKGASDENVTQLFNSRVKSIEAGQKTLYVGYEKDGSTVKGYAFRVGGPGLWGPIEAMVGVDPEATKVLGIAFTKHSETPGLGGRITEPWFTDQFKDLPLHPIERDQNIFHLKPEGTGKASNDLDAITGATITSSSVEAFLNNGLDHFLSDIWGKIEETK
jgi:Na+-transporting NADH:ubiquinone oxidoreductase subunit C